ncbi:hypothetical protein PF004_g20 [Phytophthora fragariae]|uniref:Major facilitator superfamily (MFS) profile domain-containing protein n=1 Tax=Phytophthora fragariae TaxID=53985 RepID=A0A6G0PWI9_9STRA|nr:hypothetical protein PF004_g20 [Phytophthora fragariae]
MLSPLPRTPGIRRASLSYDAEVPLKDQREGDRLSAVQEAREETQACWLFALVGVGYLFPFSALTQPVDYWHLLFPDFNIEFALTSTFMYTNLVFLGVIVLLFGSKPWYTGRIVGGFLGQLLVLAFVPTSYFLLTSEHANAVAVLGGTAVASIATAFIDSSTIALVSQYPQRVQESFQLGVGLSTLVGSLYRDLTKLVFPADQLLASSLIYFYTGALTIALCIGAFYKVMALKITRKYLLRKANSSVELTERSPLLTEKRQSGSDPFSVTGPAPTKWSVLRKVWHLEVLILAVFLASLSVWPPLVTEIKTYNFPSLQESGWWSLILLTLFSVSDCAGRFVVNHRFGLTPGNVWIPILARFILVPIIIGIVKGWWLQSDIWSVLSVVILGLGNGYLGTLTIIFVSESVHSDEQHLIGPFTSFFLNSGLVLGSTVGLVLEKVVLG